MDFLSKYPNKRTMKFYSNWLKNTKIKIGKSSQMSLTQFFRLKKRLNNVESIFITTFIKKRITLQCNKRKSKKLSTFILKLETNGKNFQLTSNQGLLTRLKTAFTQL